MTRDFDAMRAAALAPVQATREQIAQAAAELSDAYRDDPLFAWIVRTDKHSNAGRARFVDFILREVILGVGDIHRPAMGGAAAVWIDGEKLRHQPLRKEIAFIPAVLAMTGAWRLHRLLQLRKAMEKHHPLDRPHDYLFFLGVAREARGKGIGSALLEASLAQRDASGRHTFLEATSEENRRLYARFGYELIGEYRAAPSAPLLWAMWREPKIRR